MEKLPNNFNNELVASWLDRHGLYTGALDYLTKEVPLGQAVIMRRQLEPCLGAMDGVQEIKLAHRALGNGTERRICQLVEYRNEEGESVQITPLEVTVRARSRSTPLKVYRPFLDDKGVLGFYLVREVIVQRHDVDATPAYLNYLITKADGQLYRYLVERDDWDEDAWSDMFSEIVLGPRRLPNFDFYPTHPGHARWFSEYSQLIAGLSPDAPLDDVKRLVSAKANELFALTLHVIYHHDDVGRGDYPFAAEEVDAVNNVVCQLESTM